MRKLLLISLLAVAASPAMATASAQCDAKPFTLKRPAAIQPASAKPAAPSTDTLVAQAKPLSPKAAPEKKSRITIGCKQPSGK
jgi:hypothetical protein